MFAEPSALSVESLDGSAGQGDALLDELPRTETQRLCGTKEACASSVR
jgi:hypothetical protein